MEVFCITVMSFPLPMIFKIRKRSYYGPSPNPASAKSMSIHESNCEIGQEALE